MRVQVTAEVTLPDAALLATRVRGEIYVSLSDVRGYLEDVADLTDAAHGVEDIAKMLRLVSNQLGGATAIRAASSSA